MQHSNNPLIVNSQVSSDGDYSASGDDQSGDDQDTDYDSGTEKVDYDTDGEEQLPRDGSTVHRVRKPRTATKWPKDTMIISEVEHGGC